MIGGLLSDRRSGPFRQFPVTVFVARVFDVHRARTIGLIDEGVDFLSNVVVVSLNHSINQSASADE